MRVRGGGGWRMADREFLDLVESATGELADITAALAKAGDWGLQTEVIWSALRAAQQNPELSINNLMEVALLEWDI